ncbi:MAG: transglutaminase-like domain-containing protein [Candidatus Thermoplasmatota archaeon]
MHDEQYNYGEQHYQPQEGRCRMHDEQYNYGEPYYPPQEGYREPPPKKSRAGKVIAIAIVLILVIAFLGSPLFPALVNLLTKPRRAYPESAHFTITRRIEVRVSGMQSIDIAIDIPLPKDITDANGLEIQDRMVTEPDPLPLLEHKAGADWMVWQEWNLRSFTIEIEYEFETRTVLWEMSSENSGTPAEVPEDVQQRYLGDEWLITPSDPQIASLAVEITAGMSTVYERLRAIYRYLDEEIGYERSRPGLPKSCTETLRDKAGDCDDQSILLCSLARAVDVPAWLEYGALYDQGYDTWGAHAWVQTYIPSEDGGGVVNIDVVNDEFLVRGANRFTEWISTGNAADLEDYYRFVNYTWLGIQPHVEITEDYTGTFEPSESKIYVPSGEQPGIPAPEMLLIILLAVASAALVAHRHRRTR